MLASGVAGSLFIELIHNTEIISGPINRQDYGEASAR